MQSLRVTFQLKAIEQNFPMACSKVKWRYLYLVEYVLLEKGWLKWKITTTNQLIVDYRNIPCFIRPPFRGLLMNATGKFEMELITSNSVGKELLGRSPNLLGIRRPFPVMLTETWPQRPTHSQHCSHFLAPTHLKQSSQQWQNSPAWELPPQPQSFMMMQKDTRGAQTLLLQFLNALYLSCEFRASPFKMSTKSMAAKTRTFIVSFILPWKKIVS